MRLLIKEQQGTAEEVEMGTKREGLTNEGYESVTFEAGDFRPGYKLVYKDREYDLKTNDLHIAFGGRLRQLLAVFDAQGYLGKCPVCLATCPKDSMVIITDYHMLYPCWECEKLIERVIDAKRVDWQGME